jgi:hypothetical protein
MASGSVKLRLSFVDNVTRLLTVLCVHCIALLRCHCARIRGVDYSAVNMCGVAGSCKVGSCMHMGIGELYDGKPAIS